ncbi:MAG TPA: histidinol-phosphatase HisJ family protein [Bacteroidales bacterium]|nr:histidinol-phosphatase HisJ family protein [Bacteroidales bacterium]
MYSLHNHTTYCDGKASVQEMISAACSEKLDHFGLSGHAPVPFENKWSIVSDEKVHEYCAEIDAAKNTCTSTKIWTGLEADYIPAITKPFDYWRNNFSLDYLIGSIHLVENKGQLWFIDGPAEGYDIGLKEIFGDDMRAAVKSFYRQTCEMIETQKPDILGHCDKVLMHNRNRRINAEDPFHLNLLKETLLLAAEKNVIVEINTRGIYRKLHTDYYPGKYIFGFLKENNVRVMLSADAHMADQITGEFEHLKTDLAAAGLLDTWLPLCVSDKPVVLYE